MVEMPRNKRLWTKRLTKILEILNTSLPISSKGISEQIDRTNAAHVGHGILILREGAGIKINIRKRNVVIYQMTRAVREYWLNENYNEARRKLNNYLDRVYGTPNL